MESRQVVVLGMHRSGTSATTGLIGACGAFVGSADDLTRPSIENPKGFFERRDARRIMDALLHSAGADWWKVREFDTSRIPPATLLEQGKEFQRAVAELDSHGTWAIKEPRLCVLLPVLKRFLTHPVAVVVARHPIEVAQSLRYRNGFSRAAGLALWEAYVIAALRASADMPRVFVNYADIIADPVATTRRLKAALESLGVVGLTEADPATIIDPALYREHAEKADAAALMSPEQQALWQHLARGEAAPDELLSLSRGARLVLEDFEIDQAAALRHAGISPARFAETEERLAAARRDASAHNARAAKLAEELRAALAEAAKRRQAEEAAAVARAEARWAEQAEQRTARRAEQAEQRAARIAEELRKAQVALAVRGAELEDRNRRLARFDELQTAYRDLRVSVAELRAGHDVALAGLTARHDAKVAALLMEIERGRVAASEAAEQRQAEWAAERAALSARLDAAGRLAAALETHAAAIARKLPAASEAIAPLLDRLAAGAAGPGDGPGRGAAARLSRPRPRPAGGIAGLLPSFGRRAAQDPTAEAMEIIAATDLFDADWYRARYPDVAAGGVDPLRHYVEFGGFEGRDPNPRFSSAWYLEHYEDVRRKGINPLLHYAMHGRRENRQTRPREEAPRGRAKKPAEAPADPTGPSAAADGGTLSDAAGGLPAVPAAAVQTAGEGAPSMGECVALLRASALFDAAWYLDRYPEVAKRGIDPVGHYLRRGAAEERDPSVAFSTAWYLRRYPDVGRTGMNPLVHYLRHGMKEGRLPLPPDGRPPGGKAPRGTAKAEGKRSIKEEPSRHEGRGGSAGSPTKAAGSPAAAGANKAPPSDDLRPDPEAEIIKFRSSFDRTAERAFISSVRRIYGARQADIDAIPVAVIMPAYNRAGTIRAAIRSVLGQEHQNLTLFVIDDGSTDRTIEIVEEHAQDPRVALIRSAHGGVSRARNIGLERAGDRVVAYLDSDNVWKPHFLRNMLTFMSALDLDCAFAGMEVRDDNNEAVGFRGARFDWEECLRANYVDLNTFCHSAELWRRHGGFDESLRRMVDWDLILRYTRDSKVEYANFIGCIYRDRKADKGRVSVAEPFLYRWIVKKKNEKQYISPESRHLLAKEIVFRIAIRIAAPRAKKEEWGDYHFAESLAESFRSAGHTVYIDFLGEWYARDVTHEDVVIVLRGLDEYTPRSGQLNILWNISHPDLVSFGEYSSYDIVYIASESYASLVSKIIGQPVRTLMQATDARRFNLTDASSGARPAAGQVLFVGNSRRVYREIVRWAIEAKLDPAVYGSLWESFIPAENLRGHNISNSELTKYYGSSDCVLNDHWDSMRDFGFVSNRIFDAVASGARVISDHLSSLPLLFGDSLQTVAGAADLKTAVERARSRATGDAEGRSALARHVIAHHSFDVRARRILDDIAERVGLPRPHGTTELDGDGRISAPGVVSGRRLKVRAVVPGLAERMTSSAYIRLLLPLTVDPMMTKVDFAIGGPSELPSAADCDIWIVQRTAFETVDEAEQFVARVRGSGQKLVVDTDDAFSLISDSELQEHHGGERNRALDMMIGAADAVWFSTSPLAELYRGQVRQSIVVPNGLDPRIWRRYRPESKVDEGSVLRLLYMGTSTHTGDLDLLMPALDIVASRYPGSFTLTLVGVTKLMPDRPWLRQLTPPRGWSRYPYFVRWLRDQGPFDVGLSPLADTAFNRCKSDIKFLDYCALGLLPLLSDLLPYHEAGRCGFGRLVGGSAEAWVSELEQVLRERGQLRARSHDAATYLWERRSAGAVAAIQWESLDNL